MNFFKILGFSGDPGSSPSIFWVFILFTSIGKIARKYSLEVKDLARMNSINENSYLYLGQQLTVGNKNIHRNIESKKRTILYSVKQGDSLYKI